MTTQKHRHPKLIWTAVVVLTLLHHDFWLWNDRSLWLGFLPAGVGYHAIYSLAAAALWALACRWAWPDNIESWAEHGEEGGASNASPENEEAG